MHGLGTQTTLCQCYLWNWNGRNFWRLLFLLCLFLNW